MSNMIGSKWGQGYVLNNGTAGIHWCFEYKHTLFSTSGYPMRNVRNASISWAAGTHLTPTSVTVSAKAVQSLLAVQ